MFGAKGSNKNRVYQFWLIRLWREKRKKRQEKAQLKKKRMEEMRNKVIEEVIGTREQRSWKLSESPAVFKKKEGVKVTIYPLGKKPDKVIEVYEEPKKVGIGTNPETEKKLTQIATEATRVVASIDLQKKEEPKTEEKLEDKKKQLERDLKKIENLQTEYQTMTKKNPKAFNTKLIKDPKVKKEVTNVLALKQAEEECKKELERVEKALKEANQEKIVEEKDPKKEEQKAKPKKLEEPVVPETKTIVPDTNNQKTQVEVPKPITPTKAEALKTGTMVVAVAGGILVAFPALIQKTLSTNEKNKEDETLKPKENAKQENDNDLKQETKGNTEAGKKEDPKKENNSKDQKQPENEPAQNKKGNEEKKKEHPKLKLYRSKLEASKEAEILIKAELERQRSYLKKLNEKVGKMEVTKRVDYHFRGFHRLLGNLLTFTLGVFTIPFSRNRIFGTAVGLTLIGNSIRGMRNSLRTTKEETYYIEWKDFTKAIYNEQLALKQMKNLVIESLGQIKGLKEDLEREFYGKVPFDEYDEMKTKLEVIELKLIEKQKQIEQMDEKLKQVEEKNKVKVKQMEEIPHQ